MAFTITTGKRQRAQRVLIYGLEGIGKTTLAANLPAPLILDTEGGSDHLECNRASIATLADLHEAIDALLQQKRAGQCPFQTVIIDTADRVWGLCADAVCEENSWKSVEESPFKKAYKLATDLFIQTVRGGLDCLANAGLHVVVCAHSKIETVAPPEAEAYNQYQVKISAPGKQALEAATALKEWADAILFCHYITEVDSKSGKAYTTTRSIAAVHSAMWEAKNRHGLPDEVPMEAKALAALFPYLGDPAATLAAWQTKDGTPAKPVQPAPRQNVAPATATPPAPRDPDATRGMNAAPATGSDPEELGGYARHQSDLPQPLKDRADDLIAFFIRRGVISKGQGLLDVPQRWMERMKANPDGVIAELDKMKAAPATA